MGPAAARTLLIGLSPLLLPIWMAGVGVAYGVPVPERPGGRPAGGTASPPTGSVTELFASQGPVEFVLAADFSELSRDRDQDPEERSGTISIVGVFGQEAQIPVKVKTRGRFRLQDQICPVPPLRLDFPRSKAFGTVFDGQDKLKVVTHCRDSDEYEQNVLEEFLAYRIYNQLTDLSFRVQLARITYRDTSGMREPVERMGFLIEDEESLAHRLGGSVVEVPGILPNQYDPGQMSLMYLFQFMVGNVDWGTGTGHNMKILLKDGVHYPVPYDFDFSGLVDAPYARPSPLTAALHDSVRERVYWGVCMPGIDYAGAFTRFNQNRGAVLASVRDQAWLTAENTASALGYLEEFYGIINDADRADREIVEACRPWL